ncbi:MAG: YegS/Rv2252/BmrU family lipid kinase [Lentimicrobiaceae bacterium]|nr:YegS/Rv2252/BmrU family lipid kinase [Lentimicrobiaceae bacterium]
MKHIFIVNNDAGEKSCLDLVKEGIVRCKEVVDYEIYTPHSPQDSIDFIKNYLEHNKEENVRFYACGGDGTINKVATGIFGFPNASMTVLPFGTGNDYVKYFGSGDIFKNVCNVIHGEERSVDIMKVNEKYALNSTHFGLDSVVAKTMNKLRRNKLFGKRRAYPFAIVWAFLIGMRNKCIVYADGEQLNTNDILLCTVSNGKYVGGSYFNAPNSLNDDGLLEVCLVKPVPRLKFLGLIKYYVAGTHIDNPKFKDIVVYRQAKKVTIEGPEGFCVSIDGEIYESQHIEIENLEKAIRFAVPRNS